MGSSIGGQQVSTEGGAYIAGRVDTGGGAFIGRDQVIGYTAQQVSVLLAQVSTAFQPKSFDGHCPYVGLAAFDEQDADRFFGRQRLVTELVSRVKSSRFVVIAGPSGSGKSSLVRAGLIPTLRNGRGIPGGERWLYESLKPGRNPLDELARVAASLAGNLTAGQDIRATGRADQTILHQWADIALKDDRARRAILFVDQFEEVFTQVADEADRAAFLNLLTYAATVENGRVSVLFTLRSDFISNCAQYPQLNALLNQEFMQVGALQPDELVNAIALPALQAGLRIDPDLVAQIVNDMRDEPGALPLMQFALKDLFDAQQARGGLVALTLNDYLARGGIRKSLERHADAEFGRLNPHEQQLARSVFTGLIGLGAQPTRREATFEELVPAGTDPADVESVVQKLADARLLTTDEKGDQDTVTIAHERLIEAWPWLKRLVEDNREVIAWQSQLAEDVVAWSAHQRDPSYLYAGARLATAQEQLQARKLALSGPARAFVDAGIRMRDAARLRQRRLTLAVMCGLTVVALVFAGLAGLAVAKSNEATDQQRRSRSRELAAVAVNQLADFPERALLIAIEANTDSSIIPTFEAEDALRQAFLAWHGRAVLAGHADAVESAAFSPDGKRIVTASDDKTARIWDAATIARLVTLSGHADWVTGAAFSPDGQRVVTASQDGTARIWDAATGAQLQELRGHAGPVNTAQFSPDGQRVVTAGDDQTARVWDAGTGLEIVGQRLNSAGPVRDAAYSPDGAFIATADANNLARVYDLSIGTESDAGRAPSFEVAVAQISSARFSPDGRRLATASRDGTARIWSLDDPAQPPIVLRGHTGPVYVARFSPDGLAVVTASQDQTARIWDAATGSQIASLVGHANFVVDAQFSPDGRFILTAGNDRTARLWDAGAGRAEDDLRGHTDQVLAARFSPDGKHILTAGLDGTTRIWDAAIGSTTAVLSHTAVVLSAAFSPDGKWVVTASADKTARVWDAATGAPLAVLSGHTGFVFDARFSPDGKRVVTAGNDGTARVWDTAAGASIAVLTGHSGAVRQARFSPDGQAVVTAGDDGTARVWDATTGQMRASLQGHTGKVRSAAFSPDGLHIVTAGDDATARVWQAADGKLAFTLAGHSREVLDAEYSPDGRRIATASVDQTARVWDAATGKPIATLGGHLRAVYTARFSPDGKTIATASGDGAARLFDAGDGATLAILRGHTGDVYNAEFSPDGRQVISAGQDGAVRRDWVGIGDVLELARQRVTRQPPELLCDERQQVLHELRECPAATPAPTPKA